MYLERARGSPEESNIGQHLFGLAALKKDVGVVGGKYRGLDWEGWFKACKAVVMGKGLSRESVDNERLADSSRVLSGRLSKSVKIMNSPAIVNYLQYKDREAAYRDSTEYRNAQQYRSARYLKAQGVMPARGTEFWGMQRVRTAKRRRKHRGDPQ